MRRIANFAPWMVLAMMTVGCTPFTQTPGAFDSPTVRHSQALTVGAVDIGEPQVTIGSAMNPVGKTCRSNRVSPASGWAVAVAPGSTWMSTLVVQGTGTTGAVSICVDHRCVKDGQTTTLLYSAPGLTSVSQSVQVKCSSSTTPKCGSAIGTAACPAPVVPTVQPTAQPTVAATPLLLATSTATSGAPTSPKPTVTPQPGSTATVTSRATSTVAAATATALPTATLTAVPQPTVTALAPAIGLPQPPVQPIPPWQLSVARDEVKGAARYTYCYVPSGSGWVGVPCTQKGRIQALFSSIGAAIQVIRDVSTRGLGQDIADRWVDRASGLGHITGDLVTIYVANALKLFKGLLGVWFSKATGGFYQIESYALRGLSNLYLKDENAMLCPQTKPELLAVLGIKVVGGRCVRDDLAEQAKALPPIVATGDDNERLGQLQSETVLPAFTDRERTLLLEATQNHHCASLAKCGVACQPASGRGVQEILLELVQTCAAHPGLTAEQAEEFAAFCTVPQFAFGEDLRQPPTDRCYAAMEEDRTWNLAAGAMLDVPSKMRWALSWFYWAVHMEAHTLMALYTVGQDVEMMYRFDCYGTENGKVVLLDNHDCPLESESEVRARLRREYGTGGTKRIAAAVVNNSVHYAQVADAHADCNALAPTQSDHRATEMTEPAYQKEIMR